eukprot:snap_masked-scaffold_13-processed-gene-10.33-mRNA-1 protein AED:1.00 eAED:1.00 QI:0/-1/0/0/-1/1/1/0/101
MKICPDKALKLLSQAYEDRPASRVPLRESASPIHPHVTLYYAKTIHTRDFFRARVCQTNLVQDIWRKYELAPQWSYSKKHFFLGSFRGTINRMERCIGARM